MTGSQPDPKLTTSGRLTRWIEGEATWKGWREKLLGTSIGLIAVSWTLAMLLSLSYLLVKALIWSLATSLGAASPDISF